MCVIVLGIQKLTIVMIVLSMDPKPLAVSRVWTTSEASQNDADISIGLPVDTTPDFSCDVALVSIPHQQLTFKVQRTPHSFNPILRQFYIHSSVLAKCHNDSTSVQLCYSPHSLEHYIRLQLFPSAIAKKKPGPVNLPFS